jgi:uncharacterized membrane protein YhaH (DUF805 family)
MKLIDNWGMTARRAISVHLSAINAVSATVAAVLSVAQPGILPQCVTYGLLALLALATLLGRFVKQESVSGAAPD